MISKSENVLGREILFCGIVKGLVSEKSTVERILNERNPSSIAISLSPEEICGMMKYIENPEKVFLSEYEIIYGTKLSRYGEVAVPPPAYVAVFLYAKEKGTELYPLDMPDEIYAETYKRCVSGKDFLMHNLRRKRIAKKKFDCTSAEEFVMLWDREIRKVRGFDILERERERYMANALLNLIKRNIYPLVVVELERLEGLIENLKSFATI